MSVELDPAELGFKRPFTHEVSQVLRLHNPNSDPVVFKVKTTAPKQYCVRPNSGRIESGRDVEVQVLLQQMKEDPPPDARCRDKFLVQSVAVSADKDFSNVAQIWSNIEQNAKSSIQERKIRVLFLPADSADAMTNGTSHPDDEPPAYSSPSPSAVAVTPQRQSTAAPVGPVSNIGDTPRDNKNLGDAVDSASNPAQAQQSTLGAATAAVSNAVPVSSEDLQAQLAAAQATISRMKQQAEEGLRQRKAAPAGTDSKDSTSSRMAQAMQNAPSAGVSVPITAGLCLLCFLLAYFFF